MGSLSNPPAIFLMGPTASGKTGLAVRLVESFPLDIISVDSALVYRGMDVGSAKPDAAVLARAPHRLVDICDPRETYSAARFREDALREMRKIASAGRVPLLVGGTMLYFRALQHGLSRLPSADPEIRAEIESEADRSGWEAMHLELARVDPTAAARIHPNDPQRIQRALEVIRLTGRPISEQQGREGVEALPYRVLKLVLCPEPRAELHRRIAQRFEIMLAEGFLDEVKGLMTLPGMHADLTSMRAVGYRQALSYLSGGLGDCGWIEKAIAATRQLAKRQLTWLRKEEGALWYDSTAEKTAKEVCAAVADFLKSSG